MGRGEARTQYERTYVLLPPDAGAEWAVAAIEGSWDTKRHTIGGSADDAGVGDVEVRRVLAVNPQRWKGDLRAFFETWYPGVEVVEVRADTPAQLARMLGLPEPTPQPGQPFPMRGVHDVQGAEWLAREGLKGWCTVPLYVGTRAQDLKDLRKYHEAGIRLVGNLRYGWAVDDGGAGTMPGPGELDAFVTACVGTILTNEFVWGWVLGNEVNNPREYPKGHTITPAYYRDFYNRVRAGVKGLERKISPAAIDPYHASCPFWGDWRQSWRKTLGELAGAEFVALHAYTHTSELARIRSDQQFAEPPLNGDKPVPVYYDLRVLESQRGILPEKWRGLPVVVTETNHWVRKDGKVGWDADAGAWVREAYRYFREQGVAGACLFRFNHKDWRMGDLPEVLQAVREG